MQTPDPIPLFDGNTPFGDPDQFTASVFAGTAEQADAFLGNPPGTTTIGPCQGGATGAIAITGVLTGPDQPTIGTALVALQQLAGTAGKLTIPSGATGTWTGWDTWSSAWFGPTDLAAGPTEPDPTGGYQLAYRLIMRRNGPPEMSGYIQGSPIPPNWPSPQDFPGRPD